MIIEQIIEYKISQPATPPKVSQIEEFIRSKGIIPLRYSIISKENDCFKIAVSGIKNN